MRHWLFTIATLFLTVSGAPAASKKPATVKLVDETVTLTVVFEGGKKMKVTTKGTKLAPGTHFVKSLRFYKKDAKKRTWDIRSMQKLGGIKAITVTAGQEKIIDPGPPLSLHLWSRQGDAPQTDRVTINFSAVGKYGAVYYPGAWRGNKQPPAPVFRLVTPDGKKLHEGRFTVTSTGACRYVWRPKAFKGKYKVEVKCFFGPYKYKRSREGYLFEIK